VRHPDAVLCDIFLRSERAVDDCWQALQDSLTTDGEGDSTEAREALTKAASAARALHSHLESSFDFSGEFATEKEQPLCE
jgi:hypothetical protein